MAKRNDKTKTVAKAKSPSKKALVAGRSVKGISAAAAKKKPSAAPRSIPETAAEVKASVKKKVTGKNNSRDLL